MYHPSYGRGYMARQTGRLTRPVFFWLKTMRTLIARLGQVLSLAFFGLLAALFPMLFIVGLGTLTVMGAIAGLSAIGVEEQLAKWLSAVIAGSLIGAPLLLVLRLVLRQRFGQRPLSRLRSALGLGHGVAEVAKRLNVDVASLRNIKPQYRKAQIPKRNGGSRTLLIPDAPTKELQRRILRRLLGRLKAHDAAHAFERGRSVATNAALHARQQVVLKMDLRDFFDQTSAQRVEAYFRRIGWNKDVAALLTRLVTINGGLPQGAPTSPRLANLVNTSLDRNITRAAARHKGTYTRYADDITISFPEDWPRKVREVVHAVRRIAKGCGYEVHDGRKLGVYRQHQRQCVCGVIVNQHLALPREVKRRLRAVEHTLKTGKGASMTASQLAGWRAYEQSLARVPTPMRTLRPRRSGTYRHLDAPIASATKTGQAGSPS
jgi:RNA-directed DNA polymerase